MLACWQVGKVRIMPRHDSYPIFPSPF
ncbi:hypothetical protein PSEUDO8BK_80063 [Pseudomonas sp. 8BK]|nr:hypothetical protein PSEUDO8BK_80063 [Pseudomonas sp. 8BK]